jgi:hypothetical protein
VELAVCEALKPAHAYGIYRLVYNGASRSEFDKLVAAARAA